MVIASHFGLKEDRNPYDAAQETQLELAQIGSPVVAPYASLAPFPFPSPFPEDRGRAK
jgi:hypothetical protein